MREESACGGAGRDPAARNRSRYGQGRPCVARASTEPGPGTGDRGSGTYVRELISWALGHPPRSSTTSAVAPPPISAWIGSPWPIPLKCSAFAHSAADATTSQVHSTTLSDTAGTIRSGRGEATVPQSPDVPNALREGVGTPRRAARRGRARPPLHRPPPRPRGHVTAGVRRSAAERSHRAPARSHRGDDGPQRADPGHRPADRRPDLEEADGGPRRATARSSASASTPWATPAPASCT